MTTRTFLAEHRFVGARPTRGSPNGAGATGPGANDRPSDAAKPGGDVPRCPTCGLAPVDDLTGLMTRGHWTASAIRAITRQPRPGGPVSLLIIDVDRFKSINDLHGHIAGDQFLSAAARMLGDLVGDVGLLGRYSGRADEFLVALPGTTAETAVDFARRMQDALGALRVPVDEGADATGFVSGQTASVGVAWCRVSTVFDGPALDALLREADVALRRAKRLGRNGICTI